MVSLKDYAKESGVTYEAVRQQVKRYRDDLEGHIHQQGRTQYLDDAGVAILDSHHAQKPVAVYEAGYDRQLRQMEQTIADLRKQLDQAKDRLIAAQERLLLSEGAQAQLEAAETARLALTEARDEYKALAAAQAEAAAQSAAEAALLRDELEAAKERERFLKGRNIWERLMRKGE